MEKVYKIHRRLKVYKVSAPTRSKARYKAYLIYKSKCLRTPISFIEWAKGISKITTKE